MNLLRWSRWLLAVGLLMAGFQSRAATAAPSPEGLSLSYLKTVDPQTCEWVRQPIPSGEPTTVFSFGAECIQSQVWWSPDGAEGLVFVTPDSQEAKPLLWRVAVAAKAGKPVDLEGLPLEPVKGSERPRIERVGYDAQGRVIALVFLGRKPQKGRDGKRFISFEGNRYPIDADVVSAGLAVAYRLEGASWKRFEVKASSNDEGAEHPGTDVLDAARALPSPWYGIGGTLPGREVSKAEAKALDAAAPGQSQSEKWMALPTPGGALFYRAARSLHDDSLYPATPVRWEQGGKPQPLEGMTAQDESTLSTKLQGDLLLMYLLGPETRSAYLYDTRSKKRLGFIDNAIHPDFWPQAGKR